MHKYAEVNRFSRGLNQSVKIRGFPVKNKCKFISAICVGRIYRNVHVLTDAKLIFHKDYYISMQTMQLKYIYSKYVLYKLDCVRINYYFPHKYN